MNNPVKDSRSGNRLRCAVYTRKSTEEGLDQEFNSLDAQREACVAYIASQVGLGWKLVPDHYGDGGISGGTMERPALQRLLQDIRDKKIDVVVVYKIDRLTRSLMDFSKIVEIFDASRVSFVSVTQQFNTTTSMGRLTLNVLLSFAQFEREVTAERIRDKIAASKRKGMWMGGRVPFGYRVENRKLCILEQDADTVRWMFDRYLVLKSVTALTQEIEQSGKMVKAAKSDSGVFLSRGKVFYLLANPIYIGKLRHHGEIHDGEHPTIIDAKVFAAVQQQLKRQAPKRSSRSNREDAHLLAGILFDENGDRLTPTHTSNHGKRYRYYVPSALVREKTNGSKAGWRIPAYALEAIVIAKLRQLLADRILLTNLQQQYAPDQSIDTMIGRASILSNQITLDQVGIFKRGMIASLFDSISIATGMLRFSIRSRELVARLVSDLANAEHSGPSESREHNPNAILTIELPISIRRRGQEQRIVVDSSLSNKPDSTLVDLIGRAHAYLDALTNDEFRSIAALAERLKMHPADISRILPLAFLSPTITSAILKGAQPADITLKNLTRLSDVPASWAEQNVMLIQ